MAKGIILKYLLSSCAAAAVAPLTLAPMALAQEAAADGEVEVVAAEAADDTVVLQRVVTTGSRIQRNVASTPAPVATIGAEVFTDRGYVSAADALNDMTSIVPQRNQAAGDGSASGNGQQAANLFGLGAGRTLTLVNGRRFVTTTSGLGDAQVDANIIPTGLIERIDIAQAGGAAVYGSDAIAGVVNYILMDDFEGLELDVQYGDTEHGKYEQTSWRVTAGRNFDNDRGNVAVNLEGSSTPLARFADFEASNRSRITLGNPLDTGPNDGIPSVREVIPAYFWNFNGNGVIFTAPAPPPNFMLIVNGTPTQFNSDGSLASYNPGTIIGIPFAEGGQGTRYSDLAGLRTGVDRLSGNIISHYDLSPNLRLNGEFLYSKTDAESIPQGYARTVLNQTSPSLGAIFFNRNNPYLTADTIAAITAARPAFGAGAPLWLSRNFYNDLFPSNIQENETETWRALVGLEGDFDASDRNFYWSASASYAEVDGHAQRWAANFANFNRAVSSARDLGGNIVCSINADLDTSNDDPACAPLNPFGAGNISEAASRYVSVLSGADYKNKQFDFLATIGTEIYSLPAGGIDLVLAYEHRREEASFTPLEADQLGLVGTGTVSVPTSGKYNTNELSAEVLVPVFGGDMTLPLVQALEFSGAYRFVDNSIAGEETVWSLGGRWEVADAVTFRASRSRNFRAPTLDQLFAPSNVIIANGGIDPCDADRIDAGPNPAIRRANCEAEWAANPQYGSLAGFQNPAENFSITSVTVGGNANLRNEVSDTTTYGIVLNDFIVPGLTISADRIEVDLTDGLSAFTTADFMAACYDSANPSPAVCSAFTRLQAPDGSNPAGTTATGRTTTFNAGKIIFNGEVYFVGYNFDLNEIWSGALGNFAFALEATHVDELSTSVTGSTFNRTDNTVAQPDWTALLNARYSVGGLRLSYQLNYLDDVLAREGANIENNPNPEIGTNYTQDLSASYDFDNGLTIRGGITNLFDEQPSYPTLNYGDILGRRYFVGVHYTF